MSQPRAKNFREAKQQAIFSSFSDKEIQFAKDSRNYNTRITKDIINNDFKFTTPIYDSQGNITTFKISKNLPGVDSSGKPSTETTDYILKNIKDARRSGLTGIDTLKLPNGTEISLAEAEAIIRSRNDLAFYEKSTGSGIIGSDDGFVPGAGGSLSFRDSTIRNNPMGDYLDNAYDARQILNETNRLLKEKQDLIDAGVLVKTREQTFIPNPNSPTGKTSTGNAEVYIYRSGWKINGELVAGRSFGEGQKIFNFISGLKIVAGSPRAKGIAEEYDHQSSGLLTTDEKDGSRPRDKNGKMIGATPLPLFQIIDSESRKKTEAEEEEKQLQGQAAAQRRQEITLAEDYVKLGNVKYTGMTLVGSGILSQAVLKFLKPESPTFNYVLKQFVNVEHWIAGHGKLGEGKFPPMTNKLIIIKSIYGLYKTLEDEGGVYTNAIVPWIGHAIVHYGGKWLGEFLIRKVGTVAGVAITTGGTALAIELVWIVGEFVITAAISESEEKEKIELRIKELTKESIKNKCLTARYIESDGKACIQCQPVLRWNPVKLNPDGTLGDYEEIIPNTLDSDVVLPIGVKTDKNGNIIYDPKTLKPEYIYPPPLKRTTPLPPRGGTPGVDRPVPPDSSALYGPRNFYGPPSTSGQNSIGETLITQTYINPDNGEEETVAFAIVSHNQSKENAYNGHIISQYVGAKNADYMQNLMAVRATSNPIGGTISSVNAGPIYSAASPSPQLSSISTAAAQNPARELEKIRERDDALRKKDKAWLALLWAGGSTDGGGKAAGGGGSVPPTKTPDEDKGPETMGGPEIIVRGTFMLDMGFDVLYVVNGVGTIIPKSNRPTIQYGSNGMG